MDVPAHECLYIDGVADYCDTARAFGMHVVQFRTTAQATNAVAATLVAAAGAEPELVLA